MTRVLLLADCFNWAWWYRTNSLKKYAPPEYDVTVMLNQQYVEHADQYANEFDCCWMTSWTAFAKTFISPWKRIATLCTCHGLEFEQANDKDWRSWATTPSRRKARAAQRLPWFHAVITPNTQLYATVQKYNQNTHLIPSGVDCEVFSPQPWSPSADGRLRVGWCANPRGTRSVKGMDQILKPLMTTLGSERFDWRINDRNHESALPREAMVRWYADLDVLISTSIVEGTPSSPGEASACNRAALCTQVGTWQDFPEATELGVVAPAYHNQETAEATIAWFVVRLKMLAEAPLACRRLGERLGDAVRQRWDYKDLAPKHLRAICGH